MKSIRRAWLAVLAMAAMVVVTQSAYAKEYTITSGDSVSIKVVGENELTKSYIVNDEGKIFMPMIREVVASGKTALELQAEITKKLSEYIKNPAVTVEVTNPTNTGVWVTGEVMTPGEIKVKPDARLLDLIQKAGGLKETANKSGAILFRGSESNTIDLDKLMKGDMNLNLRIEQGDRLHVPKEIDGKVKVLGEVVTPGEKDLKRNMTPMEAIQAAGGFKDTADKSVVKLIHKDGNTVTLNLEAEARGDESPETTNLYLQADDVIHVTNNRNSQVIVTGAGVKTPGSFPWEEGMTVMDAVTKAGGFAERAVTEKIRVVPKGGGTPKPADFKKYLDLGDSSQNFALDRGSTVVVEQLPPKEDKGPKKNLLQSLLEVTPLIYLFRYYR